MTKKLPRGALAAALSLPLSISWAQQAPGNAATAGTLGTVTVNASADASTAAATPRPGCRP